MAEILRRFTRTVHELLYGKEDRLSRCDPHSPLGCETRTLARRLKGCLVAAALAV
jgi:hypothetical protein